MAKQSALPLLLLGGGALLLMSKKKNGASENGSASDNNKPSNGNGGASDNNNPSKGNGGSSAEVPSGDGRVLMDQGSSRVRFSNLADTTPEEIEERISVEYKIYKIEDPSRSHPFELEITTKNGWSKYSFKTLTDASLFFDEQVQANWLWDRDCNAIRFDETTNVAVCEPKVFDEVISQGTRFDEAKNKPSWWRVVLRESQAAPFEAQYSTESSVGPWTKVDATNSFIHIVSAAKEAAQNSLGV